MKLSNAHNLCRPAQRFAPSPECLEKRRAMRCDLAQIGAMAFSQTRPESPAQEAAPYVADAGGGMATIVRHNDEAPTRARLEGWRPSRVFYYLQAGWPVLGQVLIAIAAAAPWMLWIIVGARYFAL